VPVIHEPVETAFLLHTRRVRASVAASNTGLPLSCRAARPQSAHWSGNLARPRFPIWGAVLLRDVQGSTWASGVVGLAMMCAMAVLHAPLVVR